MLRGGVSQFSRGGGGGANQSLGGHPEINPGVCIMWWKVCSRLVVYRLEAVPLDPE